MFLTACIQRTKSTAVAALLLTVALATVAAEKASADLDVRTVGTTIEITDTAGVDNDIEIERTATTVTVSDLIRTNHVTAPGGGCFAFALLPDFSHTANCSVTPSRIVMNLGGGSDSVSFIDTLAYSVPDPPFNVVGGEGNDFVDTGSGDDIVDLGSGNDIAVTHEGYDTISLGSGNDRADAGPDHNTVRGGDGADVLVGGGASDDITGDTGNDQIDGLEGSDNLSGGDGSDLIDGGYGNDTLDGGADSDWLSGSDGNDQIFGRAGGDIISGGSGSDRVSAGGGTDSLELVDGVGDTYTCDGSSATINQDAGVDLNPGDDCTPVAPVVVNTTTTTTTPKPPCEATPSGAASRIGSLKLKGVGTVGIEVSASKLRAGDKSQARLVLAKSKKLNKKQIKALKKLAKRIELRNAKGKIVATLIGTQWSRLAASELQPGAVNTLTVTAVPKKRGKRLLSGKPTVSVATLKPC